MNTNMQWATRTADSVLGRSLVRTDKWYYGYGLVLKGMDAVYRQTGRPDYFRLVQRYYDAFVVGDGTILTVDPNEYNLDNINSGKLLFPLYRATGDERYHRAADTLKKQLDGQPRTDAGAYWHKSIYPYQVWLDGLYMGSPFRAEYLSLFSGAKEEWDDIVRQFEVAYRQTLDPRTGLLYHAWDEKHVQPWCDAGTGRSKCFWGRAMGWYVMAIVDTLDFLPADHSGRSSLIGLLNRTLEALRKVRDPKTGVWYQILDMPDGKRNYIESSASCMISYTIAKGVRMGYLAGDWAAMARDVWAAILREFVTLSKEGYVNVHNICAGAGLGGWNKRDGTYEYYISEPIVTNNAHGVGAFLLAASEMAALDAEEKPTTEKDA